MLNTDSFYHFANILKIILMEFILIIFYPPSQLLSDSPSVPIQHYVLSYLKKINKVKQN